MGKQPGMSGQAEQFDMLYTSGALSEADYLAFRQSTEWGPKKLDVKNKITDTEATITGHATPRHATPRHATLLPYRALTHTTRTGR